MEKLVITKHDKLPQWKHKNSISSILHKRSSKSASVYQVHKNVLKEIISITFVKNAPIVYGFIQIKHLRRIFEELENSPELKISSIISKKACSSDGYNVNQLQSWRLMRVIRAGFAHAQESTRRQGRNWDRRLTKLQCLG